MTIDESLSAISAKEFALHEQRKAYERKRYAALKATGGTRYQARLAAAREVAKRHREMGQ